MAPPGGGMKEYAQRDVKADFGRAESPSGKRLQFDDLKVDLKGQSPNISAMRSQKKASKRAKPQSQHAQFNDEGDIFVDTDASEADRTSTTSSIKRESHLFDRHSQYKSAATGQQRGGNAQPERIYHQEQYSANALGADDNEELFKRELADAHAAGFTQVQLPGKPQPPTFAHTYVKGDSYPPTTSGAPSVPEQRARSDSESFRSQKATAAAQQDQMRSNLNLGSGQRTRLGRANLHREAEPERVQQKAAAVVQDHRPSTGNSSRASSPALGNFAFGPAGTKQNSAFQAGRGQQRSNHDTNQDHKVSNAPLRNDVPLELRSLAPRGPSVPEETFPVNGRPAAVVTQNNQSVHNPAPWHHSQEMGTNPAIPPYQQESPSDDYEPEGDQDQMHYDDNHYNENEDDESLAESDDKKPDHDLEELYAMDYQVLRAESMEKAPNAQPYTIDGVADSASIPDKLVAVHKISLNNDRTEALTTQANFFASLTIDEWEEAGDWFLIRFGEVVTSLRSFRREKRKAAQAFEDEIEARERAVAAKREFTQQALRDMKQNGQNVLLGTPKRGRTSR